MKIFRHEGHTVYELKKNLVFIKNKDKIKFYFPKHGFCNFRFIINPNRIWKYFHWFIRLPFFYWEKNNGGFMIGTPNSYLWSIK